MMPNNPIAFNPDMMTVQQLKYVAETLRTTFDLIERNLNGEDMKNYLEQARDQMLKRWGEPR
jgi:uncharacterized protein (UPF0276 family)